MNRFWNTLTIMLGILIVVVAAAIGYDEAPDAETSRLWENRPAVADEINLFFALAGADVDADEPLHVMGRRAFESPSPQTLTRLTVSDNLKTQYEQSCSAITRQDNYLCLGMRLPEKEVLAADGKLAGRYLALRNYTTYRSELRNDGDILPVTLVKLHSAYSATRPSDTPKKLPVDELVADTLFLRDTLAKSDQLLHRMIVANVLERNIRVITELVELGNPAQASALKAALKPLPDVALNLSPDLAYAYASRRLEYQLLRKDLLAGGGQYLTAHIKTLKFLDSASPFPESTWKLRLMGLLLKPEMSAHADLRFWRGPIDLAGRQPENMFEHGIKALLIATPLAIERPLGGPGLQSYRQNLIDLDYYIALVGLVAAMGGDNKVIDPLSVVAEWNAKLVSDAVDYRLRWDETRSAFEFDPKSVRWKRAAKESGHGVRVRVPSYLVLEEDQWRGYSARCTGNRCEILVQGHEPIVAKVKASLPRTRQSIPNALNLKPIISEIKQGQYITIAWVEQSDSGDWSERQVRLRVPAVR